MKILKQALFAVLGSALHVSSQTIHLVGYDACRDSSNQVYSYLSQFGPPLSLTQCRDECASFPNLRGVEYSTGGIIPNYCSCIFDNGLLPPHDSNIWNNFTNPGTGPVVNATSVEPNPGSPLRCYRAEYPYECPYELVGNGNCVDANGEKYSTVVNEFIADEGTCRNNCDQFREYDLRGFNFIDISDSQLANITLCACLFDFEEFPPATPGWKEGSYDGDEGFGPIESSDNTSSDEVCYRLACKWTSVGGGVCVDSERYQYESVTMVNATDADQCQEQCENYHESVVSIRGMQFLENPDGTTKCDCLVDDGTVDDEFMGDGPIARSDNIGGNWECLKFEAINSPSDPTASPVNEPSKSPTPLPTASPTKSPTGTPTASPTAAPTKLPTAAPIPKPTSSPTSLPTSSPVTSVSPTASAPPTETCPIENATYTSEPSGSTFARAYVFAIKPTENIIIDQFRVHLYPSLQYDYHVTVSTYAGNYTDTHQTPAPDYTSWTTLLDVEHRPWVSGAAPLFGMTPVEVPAGVLQSFEIRLNNEIMRHLPDVPEFTPFEEDHFIIYSGMQFVPNHDLYPDRKFSGIIDYRVKGCAITELPTPAPTSSPTSSPVKANLPTTSPTPSPTSSPTGSAQPTAEACPIVNDTYTSEPSGSSYARAYVFAIKPTENIIIDQFRVHLYPSLQYPYDVEVLTYAGNYSDSHQTSTPDYTNWTTLLEVKDRPWVSGAAPLFGMTPVEVQAGVLQSFEIRLNNEIMRHVPDVPEFTPFEEDNFIIYSGMQFAPKYELIPDRKFSGMIDYRYSDCLATDPPTKSPVTAPTEPTAMPTPAPTTAPTPAPTPSPTVTCPVANGTYTSDLSGSSPQLGFVFAIKAKKDIVIDQFSQHLLDALQNPYDITVRTYAGNYTETFPDFTAWTTLLDTELQYTGDFAPFTGMTPVEVKAGVLQSFSFRVNNQALKQIPDVPEFTPFETDDFTIYSGMQYANGVTLFPDKKFAGLIEYRHPDCP